MRRGDDSRAVGDATRRAPFSSTSVAVAAVALILVSSSVNAVSSDADDDNVIYADDGDLDYYFPMDSIEEGEDNEELRPAMSKRSSSLVLYPSSMDENEGEEDDDAVSRLVKRFSRTGERGGKRRRTRRRRICYGRDMSCAASPKICCSGFFCRCNLFGSNCKCANHGIMAKFGFGR